MNDEMIPKLCGAYAIGACYVCSSISVPYQ